jgi:hypothetical protein
LENAVGCPHEYDMEDEYDGTAISVSFAYVAFASSASSLAGLCDYWIVDSACSVNLTSFRSEFFFLPLSRRSTVGVVGITVQGSGIVRIPICLVSDHTVFRRVRALSTPDLSSRSAQKIGRLLGIS